MSNQSSIKTDERSISQSAFKVGLGSALGLIFGLVSQVLIASYFGASAEMDAFLTALAVPLYLEAILVGGLSFVFIPIFIEERSNGREDDAWALVGTLLWLTIGLLLALAIGLMFSVPSVTSLLASGVSAEKAVMVQSMMGIMVLSIPFSGIGSLTVGVENARNRFFMPAAATAVGSMANALVLVVLYPYLGALALAWAYLASVVVRSLVTLVPVYRHGWDRLIPLHDKRVIQMAYLIAPFIFFGVLTRATPIVERYFAADLPDGHLSYLGYADKVSQIINRLIGNIVATAMFPVIATSFTERGREGLVAMVRYGLRFTCAVAFPVVALLSAASVPLITTLFEYGAFDHATTLQVSRIIPIVLVGTILFQMVGSLISRAFYVLKDTHTVSMTAAVAALGYIVLAYYLARTWGYVGLAASQALYIGLTVVVLVLIFSLRVESIWDSQTIRRIGEYLAASLLVYFTIVMLSDWITTLPSWLELIILGGVGGVLYTCLIWWRDSDMAIALLETAGLPKAMRYLDRWKPTAMQLLTRVRPAYLASKK